MRALHLAAGCALLFGACLLPKYQVVDDGGTSGASGRGGSSAGTAGRGGAGGAPTGTAGSTGGGTAGSAGGAGGVNATGGTGGTVTGVGGTTAGTGGGAGRGGTTGAAGSGGIAGNTAGRGGTTGVAGTGGGTAGRGGTTGTAGTGGSTAGRGGTTGAAGTGGGTAGRGGTTGGGGSTVAPDWLQSISVIYQFEQAPDQLGVEAHGNGTLHLEEQGTFLPQRDTAIGIEGNSAKLTGSLNSPTYFQTSGPTLPSVFQTEATNSWTTGGWFHITATANQQWLIHDEGPGNFDKGGFIFYVDQQMGRLSNATAFAYCRVGVSLDANNPALSNYKEVETPETGLIGDIGFDPAVSGNWVHLVCRYNAAANELSIFVGGARRAAVIDAAHSVKSGPGPFMLGCNEPGYCAFAGNMDEVFFATTALSNAAIGRIYACGIDGSRCRCNSSSYATCGFATAAACSSLPACNSTTPP